MSKQSLHLLLLEAFLRSNRELGKKLALAQLLPGQPKILEFLLTHDGCTQREISEGCFLDKSTVTSLIKRMLSSKLINKQTHPEDQRASVIYLTDIGKSKALWVQQTLTAIDEAELAEIDEDERQLLFMILEKIIHNQKMW